METFTRGYPLMSRWSLSFAAGIFFFRLRRPQRCKGIAALDYRGDGLGAVLNPRDPWSFGKNGGRPWELLGLFMIFHDFSWFLMISHDDWWFWHISSNQEMPMYVCTYVRTYVGMDGWMDGWTDGCMDVWMYGYMDVWMYGCMDVSMDVWMYGCMDVRTYLCRLWVGGWVDGWMVGWMDGWMDRCVFISGYSLRAYPHLRME